LDYYGQKIEEWLNVEEGQNIIIVAVPKKDMDTYFEIEYFAAGEEESPIM